MVLFIPGTLFCNDVSPIADSGGCVLKGLFVFRGNAYR